MCAKGPGIQQIANTYTLLTEKKNVNKGSD